MFETNNTPRHEVMAIKPIQATRLHKPPSSRRETQDGVETQGSGSQGITMLQAERVLKSLIEQGWFEKSNKSYYSLSPRALMELRGWLIETYNEDESEEEGRQSRPQRIKMCHACKEIITTVSLILSKAIQTHCDRGNDAPSDRVSVAFTTSALKICSAFRSLESAQVARRTGAARTLSGRGLHLILQTGARATVQVVLIDQPQEKKR